MTADTELLELELLDRLRGILMMSVFLSASYRSDPGRGTKPDSYDLILSEY
jgi:hypothetical protein